MEKHSFKDWVVATRPWSFPASVMPVAVAFVWLWSKEVPVVWWLGALAVLNIILVHAAGNVWSDIADYRRGVDAADTFGVRQLVDGHFTPSEFMRLSLTLNLLAVGLGLVMVWLTGWPLLAIGIVGVALSVCYPRLKYMALGDVVIILCYALLPMLGTSFIAAGKFVCGVLWLAVPVGLITVAILHVNNVRDVTTDRRAGIHTLPMLTGRGFGRWLYVFEVLFPYVWLVLLVVLNVVSWPALAVFLSLPVALGNVRDVMDRNDTEGTKLARLDERTAQLQLAFSALLIIGMTVTHFIG
ncbi:MAG: prenyltransferase [Bacteroidaceae bacterium]|nr:prenyltransferase [Bacteroidaceae bacterium]